MALSANTMPFFQQPHPLSVPFDSETCFGTNAAAETKTSTGYYGAPKTVDVNVGFIKGLWALALETLIVNDGDEAYTFYLLGSNDASWGNGNVEILQAQNYGATTGRSIATIIGASPTIPPSPQPGAMVDVYPFTNRKAGITYRYLRAYVVIAGTSPSVKANTWITYDHC